MVGALNKMPLGVVIWVSVDEGIILSSTVGEGVSLRDGGWDMVALR